MPEETDEEGRPSREVRALEAIAKEMSAYRREHKRVLPLTPMDVLQRLGDPQEAREAERADREREQATLYKLVVLLAGVTAAASVASVVVAVLAA